MSRPDDVQGDAALARFDRRVRLGLFGWLPPPGYAWHRCGCGQRGSMYPACADCRDRAARRAFLVPAPRPEGGT